MWVPREKSEKLVLLVRGRDPETGPAPSSRPDLTIVRRRRSEVMVPPDDTRRKEAFAGGEAALDREASAQHSRHGHFCPPGAAPAPDPPRFGATNTGAALQGRPRGWVAGLVAAAAAATKGKPAVCAARCQSPEACWLALAHLKAWRGVKEVANRTPHPLSTMARSRWVHSPPSPTTPPLHLTSPAERMQACYRVRATRYISRGVKSNRWFKQRHCNGQVPRASRSGGRARRRHCCGGTRALIESTNSSDPSL